MTTPKFSTVVELLQYRAIHQSDQIAYTFLLDGEVESGQLNYQELDQRVRIIAAQLLQHTHPGERAVLLYPSGLDFITAFLGCLYAGVVAVPVSPAWRTQQIPRLAAIVNDALPSLVLTTTSILTNYHQRWTEHLQLSRPQWVSTDSIAGEVTTTGILPAITPESLALLQYTSGSTGNPKGVMVNHLNLLHNCALIQQAFGDTPESIGVSWLPLYHDMGLIGGVLQPLFLGGRMVFMPPNIFLQRPICWLEAISRYRATTSGGPNFAYDWCVQKIKPEELIGLDLSCWTLAFCGAEPVRSETIVQFSEVFGVCGFRRQSFYPCYGMAETTLLVTGGNREDAPSVYRLENDALEQGRAVIASTAASPSRSVVSCGYPRSGLQIEIVEPTNCRRCEDGQVGEIWVAGDSVAQGYWHQPEQTQQIFQAHLADTGEGPFLRTGDLGVWLNGQVVVTGQLKDVIITRGQNHYPQDIEQTVERVHAALRANRGAAFAIEVNRTEQLVLVQEVERSHLKCLDAKTLVREIAHAVMIEHGLHVYSTVFIKPGSIPRTSSGKIQRYACRQKFLEGTLAVVDDWCESPQYRWQFRTLVGDLEALLKQVQTSKV